MRLSLAASCFCLAAFASPVFADVPRDAGTTSDDTWDLRNETCRHGSDKTTSDDEILFTIVNNNSDTPLSRVEIFSSHGDDECNDSASAPVGWTAQVLLDGTVVFVAGSPADVLERGQEMHGFKVRRHRSGACCHRSSAYGPGTGRIRDDDDDRDDCACTNVAVAPASWGATKRLYR